jgi:hypothetical protein
VPNSILFSSSLVLVTASILRDPCHSFPLLSSLFDPHLKLYPFFTIFCTLSSHCHTLFFSSLFYLLHSTPSRSLESLLYPSLLSSSIFFSSFLLYLFSSLFSSQFVTLFSSCLLFSCLPSCLPLYRPRESSILSRRLSLWRCPVHRVLGCTTKNMGLGEGFDGTSCHCLTLP